MKENPAEFWELGQDANPDDKLEQIEVDYENLDDYKEQLSGYDVAFCCRK